MADYEDGIFSNLPQRRRRPGERDDDDRRLTPRQLLAMNFVPEGPLPERPRPSGKGGPSVNQGVAPPPVTSVWSAADAAVTGMTLTNGGLTASSPLGSWTTVRATIGKTTGKLYFELAASVAATDGFGGFGLADATFNAAPAAYLGVSSFSAGAYLFASQFGAGMTWAYGFSNHTAIVGDVMSMAVDLDAGKAWIAYNNVWQGSGNPAAGTTPALTFVLLTRTTRAMFPGVSLQSTGGAWTLQSAAASQKYAPPSGFKAWDAP